MVARIQDAGLARVTSALVALSWWIQWGTGSGAAKTANVVTTTGTTEARSVATATQQTSGVTNNQLRLVATITAIGTPTITEVGAFDAVGAGGPPTGGSMDIYGDFTGIALAAGDSIAFTINTTFA